jgi:hypothetical protein
MGYCLQSVLLVLLLVADVLLIAICSHYDYRTAYIHLQYTAMLQCDHSFAMFSITT